MRSARLIVVGLTAAAVLALAVVAVAQRTSLAFTLGVARAAAVARLAPGEQACQQPIDVPSGAAFDRVALGVGTSGRPGSPLRLTVREAGGGRVLSTGTLAGGRPGIPRRAGPPARHAGGRLPGHRAAAGRAGAPGPHGPRVATGRGVHREPRPRSR